MSTTKSQKDEKKKLSASSGAAKKSTEGEAKKKVVKRETKPKETNHPLPAEEHSLLVEAAENIEAGAEVVGEKVSEISEKTAEVAGEVYEAIKKGLSTAYDTGAKVVDEITQTAQEYIGKYKHNMEVKKVSEERNRLTAKLGLITFVKYKMKEAAPQKLLEEKEILDMIKEIEKLDKEIVKIGKKLEKGK